MYGSVGNAAVIKNAVSEIVRQQSKIHVRNKRPREPTVLETYFEIR